MSQLGPLIVAAAQRMGIDPVDLATAISYETGGTFDPAQKGPTTQWGQHIGLIQMGDPQRKQYGYDPAGSLESQVAATERYLVDRGVKPGMGMLDIYSTINAGAPGLYNRSDANNGGAPGTVRDKVEKQMFGHRKNALGLIGQPGTVETAPLAPVPGTELAAGPQQMPIGMSISGMPSTPAAAPMAAAPSVIDTFKDQGLKAGLGALAKNSTAMGGIESLMGAMGGEEVAAPSAQHAPIETNSAAVAQGAQQMMANLLANRKVRGLSLGRA